MAIPVGWKTFVDGFGNDDPYWFFPKRSVGNARLNDIVSVYAKFDGKVFDQSGQVKILDSLNAENLTEGTTTAQIRVLRKALENLGFCWLDGGHRLRMTPSAGSYLKGVDRDEVIERHLWRYYLSNPINPSTRGLALFPHRFLIEVLLGVGGAISHDEFVLFVARSAKDEDLATTIGWIIAWRKLSQAQRGQVKNALPHRYGTIDDDATYSMSFHRLASYFEKGFSIDGKEGLKLLQGKRAALSNRAAEHRKTAIPIIYRTIADCIVDYGDDEQVSDLEDQLDYFLDRAEPAKAVEVFKKLPVAFRRGKSVAQYKSEVFLEQHLEDYLFANPDKIEVGLKNVRRQHVIESGIVDIIADDKNDDIVVIELKKTRASDKVFGQLARYMGCMKQNYANSGQKVRGYIVGSEISEKLRYAAQIAPKGSVRLKRFVRDPVSANIFIED